MKSDRFTGKSLVLDWDHITEDTGNVPILDKMKPTVFASFYPESGQQNDVKKLLLSINRVAPWEFFVFKYQVNEFEMDG